TERQVWRPSAAPLRIPAAFPDGFAVVIEAVEGGRRLAAAIELISPANKDRERKRRLFLAKCAGYLARGVGLVIVDVVTSRQGNLHNEMAQLLDLDAAHRLGDPISLYTVAYRPLRQDDRAWFDTWPIPLTLGEPMPTVPLS